MDTRLLDRELNHMSTPAKCVFVLLFLQLVLSLVMLVLISLDNSALTTFRVMLPEMQDVLRDFGEITPEVRDALSKINQLCLKMEC